MPQSSFRKTYRSSVSKTASRFQRNVLVFDAAVYDRTLTLLPWELNTLQLYNTFKKSRFICQRVFSLEKKTNLPIQKTHPDTKNRGKWERWQQTVFKKVPPKRKSSLSNSWLEYLHQSQNHRATWRRRIQNVIIKTKAFYSESHSMRQVIYRADE